MGEIRILNPKLGDEQITWNPNNIKEIDAAKAKFWEYLAQGFQAFRINAEGRGNQITEFDPEAGQIIMVPRIKGGRYLG
jgi:hypothetical protein